MHTDQQIVQQGDMATPRVIEMELLALDLSSCTRCVGTRANMEQALDTVRAVLDATDRRVHVSTRVIDSEEQARQYQLVTSPTVRINGRDIAYETLESPCDSCSDLCGCHGGINCRVWRYQGQEYTEAPVGLIVEAILHAVYATSSLAGHNMPEYHDVPDNLQRFFNSKETTRPAVNACCAPAAHEICCEAEQKETCCYDAPSGTCGCHGTAVAASGELGA